MSGMSGMIRTGDEGQRYEIRARRRDNGEVEVVGWANIEPEWLVDAAKDWSSYAGAWSVDRQPDESKAST